MTRTYWLAAVALVLAYLVFFIATRRPLCEIDHANRGVGRSGVSSIYCKDYGP